MKWVSERDLAADGVRLFCLPHAGSGAAGFYRWKRVLTPEVAVCPVMLPGREGRMGEPLMGSVEEIVAGIHAEVRGELAGRPYAVFGHSMSALIAFEWVRLIEREGLPGPVRLFVSGRNAPSAGVRGGLAGLEDEEMVRGLVARYGGDAGLLLVDEELAGVYLPILKADLRVVEGYSFAEGERLRCGVRAFAGASDGSVSDLGGWAGVTVGSFGERRFEGGHFYHLGSGSGPGELLGVVAGELGVVAL